MSKAVLISIRKEHNDKIFAGKKKWEGRKTCPGNVDILNYSAISMSSIPKGGGIKRKS